MKSTRFTNNGISNLQSDDIIGAYVYLAAMSEKRADFWLFFLRKTPWFAGLCFRQHSFSLLVCDCLGVGAFRDLGVFTAIGDVRAVTAVENLDAVAKVSDVLLALSLFATARAARASAAVAAVRADFVLDRNGQPQRIDHPGYGPSDAFYRSTGRASAIHTCNSWVADKLRLAGVKTSLWPPFVQGLVWRYRPAGQST